MKAFIKKHENWLPVLLAVFFVLLTASNLAGMRNPDELLNRVINALEGTWKFDETNFDYPSLPKYVMFWVGKLVYALGFAENFSVVARFLSVLLGAGTVFLVYKITRRSGGGIAASVFAALFLIANHILSINARFAHNDLYLTFFLTLSLYFSVRYTQKQEKSWLYAAFFSAGLAASSKYNGGIFAIVPVILFAVYQYKDFWREKLNTLETLFIGTTLTFLGFALGTPKSLFWMAFYFKRALPVIFRHASYGKTADSVRGIIGQWAQLSDTLGLMLFAIAGIAILYFLYQSLRNGKSTDNKNKVWISMLALLVFDLPIMASYNYQARFYIPLLPFFAVVSGIFLEAFSAWVGQSKFKRYQVLIPLVAGLALVGGLMRVVSVRLLLTNDSRIPAAEMIADLPVGTSLEYTMYPPTIPANHFEREHDYPVFFTKFEGQEVPQVAFGKPYKVFNEGEAGLIDRGTDYLVVDSFTYARCADENIYATNPVECAFFADLLAGKTSYEMIAEFTYTLPKYLPQISIAFVNPEIQIFQKKE